MWRNHVSVVNELLLSLTSSGKDGWSNTHVVGTSATSGVGGALSTGSSTSDGACGAGGNVPRHSSFTIQLRGH